MSFSKPKSSSLHSFIKLDNGPNVDRTQSIWDNCHPQYQINKFMSFWHETKNISVRVHSLHPEQWSSHQCGQEASHIERMMSSKWSDSSQLFGSLDPRDPIRSITLHRKWSHILQCIVYISYPLNSIPDQPAFMFNLNLTFWDHNGQWVMKCKICSRYWEWV